MVKAFSSQLVKAVLAFLPCLVVKISERDNKHNTKYNAKHAKTVMRGFININVGIKFSVHDTFLE